MDGKTMREPEDARRLAGLPEHESDADVDRTMGAGVMAAGGTAIDRGTGELGGVAQGPDAGERDVDAGPDPEVGARMADMPAATPGIVDYTQGGDEGGDGAAGR